MSQRFAILIGVAALGAAVIATGASANFRSVDDPSGDARCEHGYGPCSDSDKRRADIVRATAGHAGEHNRQLKHTIRVVGKFQSGGYLAINTDSDDSDCEYFLRARRGRGRSIFRKCGSGTRTARHARMDFHLHSVEIFFSKRSIGNLQSYGWSVYTAGGEHAFDEVPNRSGGWIRHRFGVAAAGVMVLGAQTAAAEVVKYDTELTLTKEGGGGHSGQYHGWVMSDRDRNPEYDPAKGVRKCMVGRLVVLFKKRPGADRRLGTDRSEWGPTGQLFKGRNAGLRQGRWEVRARRDYGDRVRAVVKRKVRDRYVCRADRSAFSS